MLVMVVFFIAFRWIHLSTPLIRLFLLVLILLLMPTLNFLPVRSEERRVGKEWRSRWMPVEEEEKKDQCGQPARKRCQTRPRMRTMAVPVTAESIQAVL